MRTPKEYTANLNNGIITADMLSGCLFSVNKRAKNYRDKEREYRHKFDYYNNEEKNREKKEEYYHKKDLLLGVIKPTCIHCETITRTRRQRIYDYEPEYDSYIGEFVHQNSYWDRDECREVEFGDIVVEEFEDCKFYLFYDLGNHSFHTPIDYEIVDNYSDLEVVEIRNLNTKGNEINELLSTQFVDKVLAVVLQGNYKYVN